MDTATLLGLVLPGLATGVGGLGLLLVRRPTTRLLDALAGVTGGIMLAAAMFSLLVPALERGTLVEVLSGLAVGAGFVLLLDIALPHVHARFAEGRHHDHSRSALLLSAMTIHNIPEGLAVGVAYAAGGPELGLPVAIAIGVQNVPEGFASAAPLLAAGRARRTAVGFAVATGLVEPPAALLGFSVEFADAVLPFALAFAAGAMIYVVIDELVPESHRAGNERIATLSFLGGFGIMFFLDNVFG